MAGFNIKDFQSEIARKGTIRSNHGQIIFTSPNILQSSFPDNRAVLLRCDKMNIPAIWFTTDDSIRRYGYGPIDNIPQHPQFDSYSIDVIADKNGYVHRYFTSWLNGIVNFNSTQGMGSSNDNGALPYESTYRSDYITDITMKVYDVDTSDILEYRLTKAWPKAIQEQTISWNETDQIVRLSITFEYRDWALLGSSSALDSPSNPSSIFDTIKSTFSSFLGNF